MHYKVFTGRDTTAFSGNCMTLQTRAITALTSASPDLEPCVSYIAFSTAAASSRPLKSLL